MCCSRAELNRDVLIFLVVKWVNWVGPCAGLGWVCRLVGWVELDENFKKVSHVHLSAR